MLAGPSLAKAKGEGGIGILSPYLAPLSGPDAFLRTLDS